MSEHGGLSALLRFFRRKATGAAAEVRYARRRALGAQDWSQPIRTMTFTVLDCEMTGLDPSRDEILSIGAVRVRGGRVMLAERFYQVFKPIEAVSSKEVILIHGLGPDEVSRGVPLADAIDRLLAFIGDSVVIGHFVALDLRFLNAALAARQPAPAREPRARHAPPLRLVAPARDASRPRVRVDRASSRSRSSWICRATPPTTRSTTR